MVTAIEQLITGAQKRGLLQPEESPSQLAFELTSYLLMANTAFVMHDDPAYLHHATKRSQPSARTGDRAPGEPQTSFMHGASRT